MPLIVKINIKNLSTCVESTRVESRIQIYMDKKIARRIIYLLWAYDLRDRESNWFDAKLMHTNTLT